MSTSKCCIILSNDNIDLALRKFKKKMEKFKILDEYKDRQFYTKPSEKKHRRNVQNKRWTSK